MTNRKKSDRQFLLTKLEEFLVSLPQLNSIDEMLKAFDKQDELKKMDFFSIDKLEEEYIDSQE